MGNSCVIFLMILADAKVKVYQKEGCTKVRVYHSIGQKSCALYNGIYMIFTS